MGQSMQTEKKVDLTAGKLRGKAALSQLLPALSTIWNLNIAGKLQNRNTQTRWKWFNNI